MTTKSTSPGQSDTRTFFIARCGSGSRYFYQRYLIKPHHCNLSTHNIRYLLPLEEVKVSQPLYASQPSRQKICLVLLRHVLCLLKNHICHLMPLKREKHFLNCLVLTLKHVAKTSLYFNIFLIDMSDNKEWYHRNFCKGLRSLAVHVVVQTLT